MSEGELSQLLGMDRVSIRIHADEGRAHIEAKPPRGEWGKHAIKRMSP
jgi:hypothetical protein